MLSKLFSCYTTKPMMVPFIQVITICQDQEVHMILHVMSYCTKVNTLIYTYYIQYVGPIYYNEHF